MAKQKPSIEIKDLLEKMHDDNLKVLNAVASDKVVWTQLVLLIENLIAREEYLALREVRPYKSMDDIIAGSTRQVQKQGKAMGLRFLMDLMKFSPDEVERRQKNGSA